MQISESEIQSEVEVIVKPIAYDATPTYPYWALDDRVFEVLLYLLFVEDVRSGFYDRCDSVTLMPGIGERGRDIKLLTDSKNTGLVQAKRCQGRYTAPQAAKELIKFGLHALADASLAPDPDTFDYYLAVSNDFTGPAIDLLDDVSTLTASANFQQWVTEVIEQFARFSDLTFETVREPLIRFLSRINVHKLTAVDLDVMAERHPAIIARFFNLRTVTDLQQTASVLRDVLSQSNIHELTDEDIRRINARISSIDPSRRFDFGTMMCFDYDSAILNDASEKGDLIKVSYAAAEFAASLSAVVLNWLVARSNTLITNYLGQRSDIASISRFAAYTLVTHRVLDEFDRATTPQVLREAHSRRATYEPLLTTVSAAIQSQLNILRQGLAGDWSAFSDTPGLHGQRFERVKSVYLQFSTSDDAKSRLESDFRKLVLCHSLIFG